MALSSDILTRIQTAAVLGVPLDETGLDVDDEVTAMYDTVMAELDDAPDGSYPDPVFDWPDDRFDDLIERTYAAHGAPRTLAQMQADDVAKALGDDVEDMSLVSKAVSEARFTLGPMYIPDRMDAHGEWTDADELQGSVWDYVRKGDRRIRLQHNRDIVAGEALEIMAWPYEVEVPVVQKSGDYEPMTFPANTVFLGVQWEPWAWELVKAGKIRGYSIGGKAQRLLVDLPEPVGKSAEPAEPDPDSAAAILSAAITEAMKAAAPIVNVVMPGPRTQRIERDEQGRIVRVVEE